MDHKLELTNLPRTQSRGSKAIDHIWATKHMVDNVTRAGFAPFSHMLEIDHR